MFGRTTIKSHAIVMGAFALTLLAITASNVQAKAKAQNCPPDEVMVGLNATGGIVCAAVESERPNLTERYVFVSSQTYIGDLGGVVGADRKCTKLAIDAGIYRGYPFKAWISDDAHSPAADFVKSEVPYMLVNGDIVADDWNDLTTWNDPTTCDGEYCLDSAINVNESGGNVNIYAWTNTDPSGMPISTESNETCDNWTDSIDLAYRGVNFAKSFIWTMQELEDCFISLNLYCFEQ